MHADAPLSAAGMRIMKLLVGNPPQSVDELIEGVGVTRTAVMGQLSELVAAGVVERERTPCTGGRGRPKHLYRASDSSLQLFASHWLVVPAIWRAIGKVGGDELLDKVLDVVGDELIQYFNRWIQTDDPKERLRELGELLRKSGELIDVVEEDGKVILRKRSCTFLSLHEDERDVSCLGEGLMTKVVGKKVCRTSCRHEGAPCCTFELADE